MTRQRAEAITWYLEFGERLQFARKALNISEEKAAAAFYVTVKTYRKWERGGRGNNHHGLENFHRRSMYRSIGSLAAQATDHHRGSSYA
jgi:transcriptional regulator with XRE-family HTH domain